MKTGEYLKQADLKSKHFFLMKNGSPTHLFSSWEEAKNYCNNTQTPLNNIKCFHLQKADWHWEEND